MDDTFELVERIQKLNAELIHLEELNAALRKGQPIGPLIGARALVETTQQRDKLVEAMKAVLPVLREIRDTVGAPIIGVQSTAYGCGRSYSCCEDEFEEIITKCEDALK